MFSRTSQEVCHREPCRHRWAAHLLDQDRLLPNGPQGAGPTAPYLTFALLFLVTAIHLNSLRLLQNLSEENDFFVVLLGPRILIDFLVRQTPSCALNFLGQPKVWGQGRWSLGQHWEPVGIPRPGDASTLTLVSGTGV